jgi:WD40 repeat protein
MLTLVVNADDDGPAAGTKSGSPSAADLTRTGEPLASARRDDAASAPAMPSRNPGRYRIIAEHGRGGLGRVSRAHDRDLDREIAIKEMLSGGHLAEVRFLREAMITARLQHPGIVPVYEAGRWPDGTPYYAMKLVAGRPLRELIVECTTVEQRIGLLHHVIAVADAIAYAHDRNIIHRDLKPANVIVGDFGETIVIDWGLAKDLSAAEESSIAGGPFRIASNDLTSAGGVLGTPTYMAPEQERGEPVDQRADVFAIGAMLWELCSPEKIPSVGLRQRHRILRRAGIDRDLVTIIDKALDPEPGRRYPDAASLSADLKAFKSGARIAARRYSLLAILGHWMRRHRALTASMAAAVALAVGGAGLYVRNIAAERDRAEASSNRLILKHAELLLQSDPTEAFDLLQTYRGADLTRAAMLRAEAQGLGLSSVIATPHTQAVVFAHAVAEDTWVTLGFDGTVARTTRDGHSVVLERGVTAPYAFDYSDRRHLLAFTCKVASICLLDVRTGARGPALADVSAFTSVSVAFSPSGDLLAAISSGGELSVWQLSSDSAASLQRQRRLDGARSISFVDENTIAAQTPDHVVLLHLDSGMTAAPAELSVPSVNNIASSGERHLVAAGTAEGALVIIDSRSSSIVQSATVCKGAVNKVLVLSAPAGVAYACLDGDAGLWDLESKPRVLAFVEGGVANLAAATDGRHALIGGNNGKLLLYDFMTQILSTYLGHASRLTVLLPPSMESQYVVSGDVRGYVRIWSPPVATARVAIKTPAAMYRAMLLPNRGPLIALSTGTTIPWFTRDGSAGAFEGHDPGHFAMADSPAESRFAVYGTDDEIELWTFEPHTNSRKLRVQHGTTTALVFTADGTHLVAGSSDGTLTEWSKDGAGSRELGTIDDSVAFLRAVPNTSMLTVGGASGRVWLVTDTGISLLGTEPGTIKAAACSNDSRWLAVATSGGVVRLYDLSTRHSSTILSNAPTIGHLSFSRDSTSLAIATRNKVLLSSIAESSRASAAPRWGAAWQEAELSHAFISFSPDNHWLATTCDDGIWFYRRSDNHWVYLSVGPAKVSTGRFSDDGIYFIATDGSGRALMIDMRTSTFD